LAEEIAVASKSRPGPGFSRVEDRIALSAIEIGLNVYDAAEGEEEAVRRDRALEVAREFYDHANAEQREREREREQQREQERDEERDEEPHSSPQHKQPRLASAQAADVLT